MVVILSICSSKLPICFSDAPDRIFKYSFSATNEERALSVAIKKWLTIERSWLSEELFSWVDETNDITFFCKSVLSFKKNNNSDKDIFSVKWKWHLRRLFRWFR